MAFDRQPIFVFENENSVGLDIVPLNALIALKCSGKIYQKIDNTGILNATTLASVKDTKIKEYKKGAVFSAGLFYGGRGSGITTNIATILSSIATLKQAETNIGTAKYLLGGANVGTNALFYAGMNVSSSNINQTTLLSPLATLVQPETNIGTARYGVGSAEVSTNALFFGGFSVTNKATILSPTATLVQAESNVGTARTGTAGSNAGVNALFFSGHNGVSVVTTMTLLTPTATLAQAEVGAGTGDNYFDGVNTGSSIIYRIQSGAQIVSFTATILQAYVAIGSNNVGSAGSNAGINALFYGGDSTGKSLLLSPTATLVQAETNVGTVRGYLGGASI